MRESISNFLKNYPLVHNFVTRSYWTLRKWRAFIQGTSVTTSNWSKMWNDEWINEMREKEPRGHRALLLDYFDNICCVNSVLEVGCNCGANLYWIAKNHPTLSLKGFDVNEMAVQRGSQFISSQGLKNVELSIGRADDLGEFENKSIDVMFSDAVLIYVGPDRIKATVSEMVRVCRGSIMLFEWHTEDVNDDGRGQYWCGYWVRSYVKLFQDHVDSSRIKCTKLPASLWNSEGWKRFGYVVEVKMSD